MPDTTQLVGESFSRVLESLAFMFADPAERADMPRACECCLRGEIGFRGDGSGALTLMTPLSVAEELASNLLSLEPGECDRDAACDALGEVMNVTLGRLLTSLAGAHMVFDLTPPRVAPAEAGEWDRLLADPDAQALMIDDRPVLLQFTQR
jgi:hypothetical protein